MAHSGTNAAANSTPSSAIVGVTYTLRMPGYVIEAVRASDAALALCGTVGVPLPQAFPHLATLLTAMCDDAASGSVMRAAPAPYPQSDSPNARCVCVPLPRDVDGGERLAFTFEVPVAGQTLLSLSSFADLDAVVEAIADGVVICNRDSSILLMNSAMRQLLGWDASMAPDFAALRAQLTLPADGACDALMQRALDGQSADYPTAQIARNTDTRIPIALRVTPVRHRTQQDIIGVALIAQDMSAWYEADQMKEEFISVASHELRAPLQPLILASRFMQRWSARPDKAGELPRLADEVVTQSKRMARLVNDMLDMTRINAGRFTIQPTTCDYARLVRDAVDEVRAASHRDITLTGAAQPIPGNADEERLWQVFTNVLTNAVKYSIAPAPVEVAVELRDATYLRVSVRDHGVGIPAADAPHLFERFYRATVPAEVMRQQRDGLGLGLYITQAIVMAHGGRVSVTSTVGEGSVFTIDLPLSAAVSE